MATQELFQLLGVGMGETLYMTLIATLFSYAIGVPIGVGLVYWAPDGLRPRPAVHKLLELVVNVVRSVPFIILIIFVMPLTKFVMGTRIGTNASIFPLVVAAAPYVGRMVESSLLEVDKGVVEAAHSMGASRFQIITRVFLSESLPSLIKGAAIATTTILGYSAMAGTVGGGGLGSLAHMYGYLRGETLFMNLTVLLLVIIVQIIEWLGGFISKKVDKR